MEKHNHEHHKHHTHEGHQKSQSSDHQTINKSDHQHGHHDHHAMMIEDFKKRFWISLVLTVPILALSHMIQQLLGFELTFFGDQYVLFGLSTIVFFYGGWPFLKGLWDELNPDYALEYLKGLFRVDICAKIPSIQGLRFVGKEILRTFLLACEAVHAPNAKQ